MARTELCQTSAHHQDTSATERINASLAGSARSRSDRSHTDHTNANGSPTNRTNCVTDATRQKMRPPRPSSSYWP